MSSIAEKLKMIAENQQKLYEFGLGGGVDPDKIIEATATGNRLVSLDEVSEVKHNVKIKVSGKNLIPYPYTEAIVGSVQTHNGLTYTFNSDRSITVTGRTTSSSYLTIVRNLNITANQIPTGGTNGEYCASSHITYIIDSATGIGRVVISFSASDMPADGSNINTTIYPQIEKGTTATSYVPYSETGEGMKVTVSGKNLFNDATPLTNCTLTNYDNTVQTRHGHAIELPQGVYTLSVVDNLTNQQYIYCAVNDKSGNLVADAITDINGNKRTHGYLIAGNVSYYPIIITVKAGDIFYIYNGAQNNAEVSANIFSQIMIQIEAGRKATEYEPCKIVTEYTADSNGIVTAASISPTMNIVSDGDMTVEYRKSWGMQAERDAFWDSYQECGKRTKYNYAFTNFDADIFYPKYDIRPTQLQYGFGNPNVLPTFVEFDLTERLRECGVVLDTGDCTDLTSVFLGTNMVGIPTIDLRSATSSVNVFRNAMYIRRIEKLIVTESNVFTGSFQANNALEELRFEGNIANDIDLHWSTKLSHASIESVLSAAYYREDLTKTPTVTLSKAAVDKAYETSVGANDGSVGANWVYGWEANANFNISLL